MWIVLWGENQNEREMISFFMILVYWLWGMRRAYFLFKTGCCCSIIDFVFKNSKRENEWKQCAIKGNVFCLTSLLCIMWRKLSPLRVTETHQGPRTLGSFCPVVNVGGEGSRGGSCLLLFLIATLKLGSALPWKEQQEVEFISPSAPLSQCLTK